MNLLVAADAGEGAVFEEAEQFGLEGAAHVADFVQEDGAAVGFFDAAEFLADGAGEGAFFVAEEFAFQEVLGDGGAIDADVIVLAAAAQAVERAGDQFLAGAAFAQDQDGGVGGGDVSDELAQFVHLGGFADDLVELVSLGGVGAQGGVFAEQAVAFGAAGDGVEQFLRGEGLGQVINGAGFDGFDRQLGGGVGGDHQEGDVGPAFAGLGQELHSRSSCRGGRR